MTANPPSVLGIPCLALLGLVTLATGGCSSESRARVSISFDPPSLAAEVASLELYLVKRCEDVTVGSPPALASQRQVVERGAAVPAFGSIPTGKNAIYVLGRDASCAVVAARCEPFSAPAGKTVGVKVVLVPVEGDPTCAAGTSCAAGLCVAGTDDAGPEDADAGTTDAPPDAVLDAPADAVETCEDTDTCDWRSCKDILEEFPGKANGTYPIDADGPGGLDPFEVYCDMTGGGYTLIALNSATTSFTMFDKDWAAYKAGFGELKTRGMGWLGLDRMNVLTAGGVSLRVRTEVRDHDYEGFSVGDESGEYVLQLGFSPNENDAGSFYSYHRLRSFSTHDNDNDGFPSTNCAAEARAGWWYNTCYKMSLAGDDMGYAYWRTPTDAYEATTFIEMWIR